jgi:hypothetical protein
VPLEFDDAFAKERYHFQVRGFFGPYSNHQLVAVLVSGEKRVMGDNRSRNAETEERLKRASRCLIESNRTLDREVADTLRNLAKRYFKEADRHKDE